MTTTPAPSITVYTPTGTSTGPFATNWKYAASEDVRVYIETDDEAGPLLVQGTDYTLTGSDPTVSGGSVALAPASVPAGGWSAIHRLIVYRRTPRRQSTAFPDAEGHKPRATEQALDRAMRIAEELSDAVADLAAGGVIGGGGGGGEGGESDAFLLNRANHTGQQPASTISDFNAATYARMKVVLQPGANVSVTPNDGTQTIAIAASGGGGGGGVDLTQSNIQIAITDKPAFRAYLNVQEVWPEDFITAAVDYCDPTTGSGTNYATALQAAANEAAARRLPLFLKGYYRCDSDLVMSGNVVIRGLAESLSGIVFADERQIVYTGTSTDDDWEALICEDFSVIIDGQSSKSAIKATWADSGLGRTVVHGRFHRLFIKGRTVNHGFKAGLELINPQQTSLELVTVRGDFGTIAYNTSTGAVTYPVSQAGVLVVGTDNPTDIRMNGCRMDGVLDSIKIAGAGVEGIYVHQHTCVGCRGGILDEMDNLEPLLFVTDSHLNTFEYGIKVVNRTQYRFAGNLIYGFFRSWTGISVNNNNGGPALLDITNNTLAIIRAENTNVPNSIGISVQGAAGSDVGLISGNKFQGGDVLMTTGIVLANNTDNVTIADDNQFFSVTTPISVGTSTTNRIQQSWVNNGAGVVTLQGAGASQNRLTVTAVSVPASLYPSTSGARDLGIPANRWKDLYATKGDFSGDVGNNAVVTNTGYYHNNAGTAQQLISATGGYMYFGGGVAGTFTGALLATNLHALGGFNIELGSLYAFNNLFLKNAVTVVSDGRLKRDDGPPSEAVLGAVRRIPIKAYKMLAAIEEKGEAARTHFGVIAQDVIAAFEAEGLDPFAYTVVNADPWMERVEGEPDENGQPTFENVQRTDPVTGEPMVRYSIRYDVLAGLMIAVERADRAALESRVAATEATQSDLDQRLTVLEPA